jgi:hypothetical protein
MVRLRHDRNFEFVGNNDRVGESKQELGAWVAWRSITCVDEDLSVGMFGWWNY